jgi:hypothetical protein
VPRKDDQADLVLVQRGAHRQRLCASLAHMLKWPWRRRRGTATVGADWERRAAAIRAADQVRQVQLAGREAEVAELEVLLFRHDRIGINFGTNTDEYRSEAETITLRRSQAQSLDDTRRIVHEEFTHWFGAEVAGPQEAYEAIAKDIWTIWSGRSDPHGQGGE